MNDFTKEELENILVHLRYSVGEDLYDEYSINMPSLYLKVSTMIENYCEHLLASEADVFVDVCQKCDSLIPRNETC
jgi:hypothetical protein